ncbi:MAG: hypothetical protein ACREBB_02170 [Nitrosotalea sp.]
MQRAVKKKEEVSLGLKENEPIEHAEKDMDTLTKKVMKDMWD